MGDDICHCGCIILMNSGDDYTISVICLLFLDLKFILCNTVMKDKNVKELNILGKISLINIKFIIPFCCQVTVFKRFFLCHKDVFILFF